MRRPLSLVLGALALVLAAAPADAQWQRIDDVLAVNDLYAVNLVGSDDAYVYATVLAGQSVPARFEITRSADDGASWQTVFSGYTGGVRGSFLGDLGGQMAVLLQGGGETALLRSDDHGATWAETPARMPTGQGASVARDGETYVVTGGNVSYRSTDSGATWTTLEERAMAGVVHFGGAFYALSSVGELFRLDGTAWTAVPFGASVATNLWVEGGQLWVKAAAAALYASADGAAWAARPTAAPTTWGRVLPAPADGAPWFLHNQAAALDLLLSDDDGATAASIADGYPRDDAGGICTSNYAVSANAVVGNAWACSFTETERNGVWRYVFGETVAVGPLDPSFGVVGRVALPFASGIETGVAVLPVGAGAGGRRAEGDVLLAGSFGAIARLRPDGTLDPTFGTDGVARPRFASAAAAFPLADGAVLFAGVGGVWRATADGALDTSYGTDGVADLSSSFAAPFADGSVVLQGFFDPAGGSDRASGLVKLTPDGAVDTAFGTDGYVFPAGRTGGGGVAVDGQGRTVALFNDGASDPTFVYRFDASGAPDAAFGTGGVAGFPDHYRGSALTTDASDRVLLTTQPVGGSGPNQVLRLTPSGGLDATFGAGGVAEIPPIPQPAGTSPANAAVRTLRVGPDGAVTAAGSVLITRPFDGGVTSQQQAYLARVTAAGAMDAAFGTGGQFWTSLSGQRDALAAVAFDADGRILAAGASDTGRGLQDERAIVFRAFPNVGAGGVATEGAPEPAGLGLAVWPNPSRGAASVRLRTEAAGTVAVDLFDTLGRRVARLGSGEVAAGEAVFTVPSGLAPGVYVVRAAVGGRVVSRTLTVAR